MTESCPSIPEHLLPLYESATAHEAVKRAIAVLSESTAEEQRGLLSNDAFIRIVNSALYGLDGCYKEHFSSIIDAVKPGNQELALYILG